MDVSQDTKARGAEPVRPGSSHETNAAFSEHTDSYSVYTKTQKIVIVCLIGVAGFFSPFTAFVYFPALRSISSNFGVSIELMNITVTTYLIVQGIIPSFLGEWSENIGRRPTYLIAFAIYCASSVGLALQRDYAALLVLRMLQSTGSSPAIPLAYGVIGDIAAPHERGSYIGATHIGFNSAPALGPVIGGVLADRVGWPWIFVFLAAFSGLLLVLLALFLNETARGIVGNGSIPPKGINRTLFQYLRHGSTGDGERRTKSRVPNIVPCLKLVFQRTTFPVLLSNATFYMMYSCLQATLAPLLEQYYGLSPLQAGLCYLSYGVAGAIASYSVGLITDRDYRITAKKHNFHIDRRRGDDLLQFPIEEARLRSVFIYIPLCATATIAFGWTLSARAHLSVPLILQFIVGLAVTGVFNVHSNLIVDMNPAVPVTAAASVSITRCLVAAGGVALIEVLIDAVGPGWSFTVVGGLCWMTLPLLWFVRKKGWGWRRLKARREQDRERTEADETETKV